MWGKQENQEEPIPMGMDLGEPIEMEMDKGEPIPLGAGEEEVKITIN